ncbi:M56 family metallopeptidase [Roseibium album]|uniref:Regulatory protein BlaR1 n=1 Tax=Roseibium album TaxID=311410 RepID=A0A0M7A2X7_9HYPH|nr:M56 family metallopeptidase [Roseibium album]MBG6166166.1 beta-lactamase regulating signal transducer with metallopeptidase domain [Labrenzia sp. EL_195]CTQ57628.1 Regulatory protein BlaR1 [Roseibium album]CTQ68832.1 Regulatory protein BlaR1 [Roseibium album]CTQ71041.1 Regulatory protein BlaR1 [Roseibium album]
MTLLNQIFDIYVDLNITLALTAIIWLSAKLVLARLGKRLAFNYQLAILNGLFAVMVLSPVAVAAYQQMQMAQVVPVAGTVNLTDYAVSQYLRGGIAIPAEDFQSILGLRSRLTESVLSFAPGAGMAVVLFLLAGFTYFGAKLAVSVVRLNRMLAACHTWRCAGRLHLLLSDRALVPFSARGLRRHYVVIPSDLLARSEDLKLVLKHELQHVRQGDVTWEIGLELLRPFFFWNPFFYLWKSEVERLRELACDQKVTDDANVDLRSYCMCLLRAAQAGLRKRQNLSAKDRVGNVAAVALIEVQNRLLRRSPAQKLRRRVEALLERDRLRPHWGFVCLAVLPMIAVVFLSALSIQKPADWTQDRLMLSTIINLERLETINTFGQRPLR